MKTALLVIDVQKFFINQSTKDIPRKIASFIRRNNFVNVYFFKFVNSKESNWYKAGWRRMMNKEETDIVPELQLFSNNENTFTKSAFSVFRVKNFVEIIKKKNITKLLICGLDTHACIYTTTLEAYERGYMVNVISDLCGASHGKKYHSFALKSLLKNLGNQILISTKDLSK